MFVLARTITYASIFVGLVLIYLPARVLGWAGVAGPAQFGWQQYAGIIVGSLGAALTLWCVASFAWIGKGTPAPFDPPRRLVARGPYQFVRNPMYIGAATALAGASLFYHSVALLLFVCGFALVTHLFIILYEEPTLRRSFGPEYTAYCKHVHRWWPAMRASF